MGREVREGKVQPFQAFFITYGQRELTGAGAQEAAVIISGIQHAVQGQQGLALGEHVLICAHEAQIGTLGHRQIAVGHDGTDLMADTRVLHVGGGPQGVAEQQGGGVTGGEQAAEEPLLVVVCGHGGGKLTQTRGQGAGRGVSAAGHGGRGRAGRT